MSVQRPDDGPSMGAVAAFFGLTFLITLPFWLLGAIVDLQLLPGLPIAALAIVAPALAGTILTLRRAGLVGARTFLARGFDVRTVRSRGWWALLLAPPLIAILAFLILRLGGTGIPDPQWRFADVLTLCALFLIGGIGEELGWSGFALGPMQARWGPFAAALSIGGIWSAWHYPALSEAHRSLTWIAWWTLGTIGLRLIMVQVYNRSGASVLAVAIFHAVSNLSWQLFPIQGSWFDPRLQGVMTVAAGLALFGIHAIRTAEHRP